MMRQTKKSSKASLNIDKERTVDLNKRSCLKWTTPVVISIVLPAHAQTSSTTTAAPTTAAPTTAAPTTAPPAICNATPIVSVKVPAKCSGQVLSGQATVTVTSDSSDLEITSISHNAPQAHTLTLPSTPVTVTSSSGVDIVWQGPGSDALLCLPVDSITITISYTCNGDPMTYTTTFNLSAVLS